MRSIGKMTIPSIVLAAAFALSGGCSGDSTTSPGSGSGGGGGGSNTLTLPTGQYDITSISRVCGDPDSLLLEFQDIFCEPEVVDEIIDGIPCDITVNGNTLTVNCTVTVEVTTGCFVTYAVMATGMQSGNTWTIEGTVMIMDMSPPNCLVEPPCTEFKFVATRTSSTLPMACDLADPGTLQGTMVGGPLAGPLNLMAVGGGTQGASGIAFSFVASGGTALVVGNDAANTTAVSLSILTPEIDPRTLPVTLPIVVSSVDGQSVVATTEHEVIVGYSEITTEPFSILAADAGSGTVTINELSEDHMVGSMSLNLSGTASTPGSGNQNASTIETRAINADYFVGQQSSAGSSRSPVDDAQLLDGLAGVKDGIADQVQNNLPTVQVTSTDRPISPWANHGVFEFSTSGMPSSVSLAEVTFYTDQFGPTGPEFPDAFPMIVDLYMYEGNGVVELDDFIVGTLVATVLFDGETSFTVDVTSGLNQRLVAGDNYVGILLIPVSVCAEATNCSFFTVHALEGDGTPAKLTTIP